MIDDDCDGEFGMVDRRREMMIHDFHHAVVSSQSVATGHGRDETRNAIGASPRGVRPASCPTVATRRGFLFLYFFRHHRRYFQFVFSISRMGH